MANNVEEHAEGTELDANVEVAATMGFGSFGPKPHLAKKRKIDSSYALSGSNGLPLGMRPDHQHKSYQHGSRHDRTASYRERKSDEIRGSAHASGNGGFDAGDHANSPQAQPHESQTSSQANRTAGGRLPNGEWDWQALRKGVRDENGDIIYYDASFVEDPWTDLDERG